MQGAYNHEHITCRSQKDAWHFAPKCVELTDDML